MRSGDQRGTRDTGIRATRGMPPWFLIVLATATTIRRRPAAYGLPRPCAVLATARRAPRSLAIAAARLRALT